MYDLTIIGSGPGGYAAALRAQKLGAKVSIVEKGLLGGTCLNIGCIPTKAIVKSVELLRNIKKSSEFGIDIPGYNINIKKIYQHKNDVVSKLRTGLESLLKSKGIDIIKGEARFLNAETIEVDGNPLTSKNIIVATGSLPAELKGIKFDHKYIVSSDDMLNLEKIPGSIAIIGGGVIGCEFASIYSQLGSKVTLIEVMDRLLPSEDREISRRLESILKREAITVLKGARVLSCQKDKGPKIGTEDGAVIEADIVLLCVGRRPNTEMLNLEAAGIDMDGSRILIDNKMKTSTSNIYAIGDAVGGSYLAHVASYEGIVASENIFSSPIAADYSIIPNSIFTHPEISSIGITEDKAKEEGIQIAVRKLPFAAIGKAHLAGETEGLIKIISDRNSDKILGAHIFGSSASELIAEFAIAMKSALTVKELGEVIYAHPTISEIVPEACHKDPH